MFDNWVRVVGQKEGDFLVSLVDRFDETLVKFDVQDEDTYYDNSVLIYWLYIERVLKVTTT